MRDRLTVAGLGVAFVVLGLVVSIVGHIVTYGGLDPLRLLADVHPIVGANLFTLGLAVFLVDRLIQQREMRDYRQRLIREMGSRDNGTALRAVDELRANGWLSDGSLAGADFKYAYLAGANLADADLHGAYLTFALLTAADLRNANLEGAILRQTDLSDALLLDTNLSKAKMLEANLNNAKMKGTLLRGAALIGVNLSGARGLGEERLRECDKLQRSTMPTGAPYDGRFNLPGDLEGKNPLDAAAMAEYYAISPETYLKGQAWAKEHR